MWRKKTTVRHRVQRAKGHEIFINKNEFQVIVVLNPFRKIVWKKEQRVRNHEGPPLFCELELQNLCRVRLDLFQIVIFRFIAPCLKTTFITPRQKSQLSSFPFNA